MPSSRSERGRPAVGHFSFLFTQEPGLGCWVLAVSLEKVSTGDQVTVGLTAVCSFPVLTETRFPPEFAQSLIFSSLNQLRQEVNDQQSLRDLVREENKG